MSQRTAIIVIGMHRSGTSAVAGALNQAGASLPRRAKGPGFDNELGFFESVVLTEFHDYLLKSAGSSWADPSNRMTAYLIKNSTYIYTEWRRIIFGEYDTSNLFLIKDPRICRFSALFADAITEIGVVPKYVIVVRNPLEVARSLNKRNSFGVVHSFALWLRHYIDAELGSRRINRCFVFYPTLIESRSLFIKNISNSIDVPLNLTEGIASLLRNSSGQKLLRHHVCSDADLFDYECEELSRVPLLLKLTCETYLVLKNYSNLDETYALTVLNRIKSETDELLIP